MSFLSRKCFGFSFSLCFLLSFPAKYGACWAIPVNTCLNQAHTTTVSFLLTRFKEIQNFFSRNTKLIFMKYKLNFKKYKTLFQEIQNLFLRNTNLISISTNLILRNTKLLFKIYKTSFPEIQNLFLRINILIFKVYNSHYKLI